MLSSLALGTACSNISTNCVVSPNGLASWWTGGSQSSTMAFDILGIANGSLSNISIVPGQFGSAFSFQSYGSSISLTGATTLASPSNLTVMGWVKGNNGALAPNTQTIISKSKRTLNLQLSQFSSFDITTLNPNAQNDVGALFDGRYVYTVPLSNATAGMGVVAKYDTTSNSFSSSSGWAVQDLATFNSNAISYNGGYFDGRYLFMASFNTPSIQALYDTTQSFTSSSAWTFFNHPSLATMSNASSDGRYMYVVAQATGTLAGLFGRYDRTLPFTQTSSWTFTNVGFAYAVFDGRYMYNVPFGASGTTYRFDTTQSFTASSSYRSISLGANLKNGGWGGTFDGRYVYFSPSDQGYVGRYDTALDFTNSAAWSSVLVTSIDGGSLGFFSGAVFDGKYVYMTSTSPAYLMVYDTTLPFVLSSWSSFNLAAVNSNAVSNSGMVYDGRYIYIPPFYQGGGHGVMIQYDTSNNQSSLSLNAGVVSVDGLSGSVLGPSFQLTTTTGTYTLYSKTPLSSSWHTVAGTYDGSLAKLYIDGALAASMSVTGAIISTSSPVMIGSMYQNTSSFGGLLNHVQMYNRALTTSEIQSLSSGSLCQ